MLKRFTFAVVGTSSCSGEATDIDVMHQALQSQTSCNALGAVVRFKNSSRQL